MSEGREEETKCLIVVSAVNSMGRSLLPVYYQNGSRIYFFAAS
jgi:hypothetical protein